MASAGWMKVVIPGGIIVLHDVLLRHIYVKRPCSQIAGEPRCKFGYTLYTASSVPQEYLGILLGAPGSSPAPEATLERGAPSNGSYTTGLEEVHEDVRGARFDENRFTPILLEKVYSWSSAIRVHISTDQFGTFCGKGQGSGSAATCRTSSDKEVCWSPV